MKIIYVPDSHVKPGQELSRFKLLGRLCVEERPDVIIQAGDHWDMPSLSSYDVGKKSYEGRKYKDDVAVGHKAWDVFERELAVAKKTDAKKHDKRYSPRLVQLGGNHCEGRLRRVIEGDRKLEGLIGVHDYHRHGWEWVPFGDSVEIAGVFFSHYFISGVLGRPVGGENPATALLNKMHRSCVAGHLHLWDYSERTDAAGNKIQGLVGGCFLAKDQWEDYAGFANKLWWNGITILNDVENGQFDFERISLKRMEKLYG